MTQTDSERILSLLRQMSLDDKIGQLWLVQSDEGRVSERLASSIREGRVGGVLNEVDPSVVDELQRIAREESPHGIPLLMGRDVIHGFRVMAPIPLGLAATWNPQLVERCARRAGEAAAAVGINWTFAPMIDIGRDPRWGRIAETFGEDPFLIRAFGAAMVRGFQGGDLSVPGAIAACAKHFAGYGASEGGRDYNTTSVPEIELRNVHLPPFRQLVQEGVATFMASFSDLNGVPATANAFLLDQVLRQEWGFDGLVVSDWNSVIELRTHGLTADDRGSALESAAAGLDMEMASDAFAAHLADLVREGHLSEERLDVMVGNILRVKERLGLLDASPPASPSASSIESSLHTAYEAAVESIVLLKNEGDVLPLSGVGKLAVIGPLADDPYEQLGTWAFDGDPSLSQTPLGAIRGQAGEMQVEVCRALDTTRSTGTNGFAEAVAVAGRAEVALLVLGEEAILSGEAHCRADITLPGAQEALIEAVASTGTPIVLVVMAGRPLALTNVLPHVEAILYAWHPGTMAGPALADILFGGRSPSGKLPVTFPKHSGQIPIYYAHKNTGRPPTPNTVVSMEDIPVRAAQTSIGNTSFYLDVGDQPLFPFGFGLSYSAFEYANLRVSASELAMGETLTVEVDLTNVGGCEADEVAQLYVRDPVASVTQPVRQLRGFQRIRLASGETKEVVFTLHTDDLAMVNRSMEWVTEPGRFEVGIGGDSRAPLAAAVEVRA
ncbi:MAG: glycoside hydrolase family 3 N-terminal domain-containing protein [Bacteroidota bacterium]